MYADKRVAPPLDGNAGWDASFHPDQARRRGAGSAATSPNPFSHAVGPPSKRHSLDVFMNHRRCVSCKC
jgi:hypothetical protein